MRLPTVQQHIPTRCRQRVAPLCTASPSLATAQQQGVQDIKDALRLALASTSRGASVTRLQRGIIEEAQVALESYGTPIDYDLLPGTWELLYTTAPDVLPLVAPGGPSIPFIPRIGRIYQRFTSLEEGRVENIIKLTIPGLLAPEDGATLTVGARYEPRGTRNIVLFFEDFAVGHVHISEGLQAALAPAMLPRSWVNQQLLLAIQEFQLRLPLNTRPLEGSTAGRRQGAAGYYLLSYLDKDVLVGRQQAGGGAFIFARAS